MCQFQSQHSSTGLTVLEFVACASAVVGGLWLGAMFFGVDLQFAAHTALAEVDLLDKVPPGLRPIGASDDSVTPNQAADELKAEFGTLRSEIRALQDSAGEQQVHSDGTAPDIVKQSTLNYWARLCDIFATEKMLQHDADSAVTESNAGKVFSIKVRLNRFAAKAIGAASTESVSPLAIEFGERLRAWYEKSADHYEEAIHIWESPLQARSRLEKTWSSAEMQHRKEAGLLRARAEAIRASLNRTFGGGFKSFAGDPTEMRPRLEASN